MYKLKFDTIIRLEDQVIIPLDPANTDYAAYLAWVDEGNTPDPEDIPVVDPNAVIQAHIDEIERATLMNRGAREGWITLIQEKATSMGLTEEALLDPVSGNPFYIKLREVDEQIRALRGQLV
jgi:hypothetical protein